MGDSHEAEFRIDAESAARSRTSRTSRAPRASQHTHGRGDTAGGSQERPPLPAGLYVIGTPIGNLEDITLRALRTLKMVDYLFCEDTRHSIILLERHGIRVRKKLQSLRAENEKRCTGKIMELLEAGHSVGYVTDAGTPGMSDPGSHLVREVRQAGYEVHPIPGVSAPMTLISVAGIDTTGIIIEGFLPKRPVRHRRRLAELLKDGHPFLLFEAPHRIAALLEELIAVSPHAQLIAAREMTKLYEEIQIGTPLELYQYFTGKSEPPDAQGEKERKRGRKRARKEAQRDLVKIRGEFTLIVS